MTTRKPAATAAPRRKKAAAASAPAYFLSLTIENVRCFGSPAQMLDLSDGAGRPAQWTIMLGENCVGKSVLLQTLIAIVPVSVPVIIEGKGAVSALPRYALDKTLYAGWNLRRHDSRAENFSLRANYFVGAKLRESDLNGKQNFTHVAGQWRGGAPEVVSFNGLSDVVCFGYGASRSAGSALFLTKARDDSSYVGLFDDGNMLRDAESWLLEVDSRKGASNARNQVLGAMRKLCSDVGAIKLNRDGRVDAARKVECETPCGWVNLSEMSTGYKAFICWLIDYASRLSDRYPDSPNPLAEPAVCLVDEIDLHLHPTWQRKLTGVLTELFPNTQFIVTAHSPLIVQAAMNANIVVLRREGDYVVIDNSVESLAGWSVDQILTSDLYGLVSNRAPKYDEAIAERQRLLSKPELTAKDKRRLQTLEAEVDELPVGDTAQESKAFDLVRRFAADLESKGVTRESLAQVGTAEAGNKQSTKKTSVKKTGAKKTGVKRTRRA